MSSNNKRTTDERRIKERRRRRRALFDGAGGESGPDGDAELLRAGRRGRRGLRERHRLAVFGARGRRRGGRRGRGRGGRPKLRRDRVDRRDELVDADAELLQRDRHVLRVDAAVVRHVLLAPLVHIHLAHCTQRNGTRGTLWIGSTTRPDRTSTALP